MTKSISYTNKEDLLKRNKYPRLELDSKYSKWIKIST